MKVAYFLDTSEGLGGAGNTLIMEAHLMADIHEVIVVIPMNDEGKENPAYVKRCEKYNLPHYGLNYKTSFNFHNIDLLDALENIPKIKAFLINQKINFIHSVQLNIALEMASRELNIPHLMDTYSIQENEFKTIYGDLYPRFHLCDSKLYSSIWKKGLSIESNVIRLAAINDCIIKKESYASHTYTILVLGILCDYKNQLAAIRAIEELGNQFNLKLIIAGQTTSRYALTCQQYIQEHHLEQKVSFIGFINDIQPLLKESDWLLCASMNESFPASIIEALTYDLTIISTPVAGVPEVLHDKENAFISSDFSTEAIKNSLIDCYNYCQSGAIYKIHQNAWKTWDNEFSPSQGRKKLNTYYHDIIRKSENLNRPIGIEQSTIDRVQKISVQMKNHCLYYNKYKDKCLYYSFILPKLSPRKAYIWGAGEYGKMAYDILNSMCPQIEIIAFIDSYKTGEYCDKAIIKPNELIYGDFHIFIAFSGYTYPIINYLEKMNFKYEQDIWILP